MTDEDLEKELLQLELFADSLDNPQKKFIDKDKSVTIMKQEGKNEYIEKVQEQVKMKEKVQTEKTVMKPQVLRTEAGKIWNDPSLAEWPENDFRIKVNNLHDKVKDDMLYDAFKHYKSLAKVHVVRDSSGRSRQYGFVSLLDVNDYIDAMKTLDNSFIGSRRVKLQPSKWKSKMLPK